MRDREPTAGLHSESPRGLASQCSARAPGHQPNSVWAGAAFRPEHPTTLGTMYNLAQSLGQQGRHAEAEPLFRSALEGRWRALGHGHAETRRSAAGLADTLRALGKHAEVEALL